MEIGVYETLISRAIEQRLDELDESRYFIKREKLDSGESARFLATHVASAISAFLEEKSSDKEKSFDKITKQLDLVNRLFLYIKEDWKIDTDDDILAITDDFLRGVYDRIGLTEQQVKAQSMIHPESGYRTSSLFTGSNKELAIVEEIIRDIRTANEIDFMVSFIRFTGLRLIIDAIEEFLKKEGSRLRIITTTYMGASEPKAISRLWDLREKYNNVEIKVSYNTSQERLHAKAYIFKRNNGLTTAYIGSSNLSESAMTRGLEWNMRVSSIENKHIVQKAQAAFDLFWQNENFEPLLLREDIEKFADAIKTERRKKKGDTTVVTTTILPRFERKTHQIKVIDDLHYERSQGYYKNLIIAATGTGKTAISAFDFKDISQKIRKEEHREARILFVVHRDRILQQALMTYRSVMCDSNFGELWVGEHKPSSEGNLNQLFVSIQTLNSNIDTFRQMGEDYYDYVVIDEAHHSAAGSYRILFDLFKPKYFVGLTATPERMDGKAIKEDFDNRFASEIRLYDALNQQLLCPFHYFCVTDNSVNLSRLAFRGDKYDVVELRNELCKDARTEVIQNALEKYITDPQECKAVCFCCGKEHAEFTAEQLVKIGYKAKVLTSDPQYKVQQEELMNSLAKGDINYLCVADMLNEGIDIPEIDTVLFLRPTESLTIFLQQLGRGLRTADGKTELTVLDFVAQANKKYDYASRFRAITGGSVKSVEEGIKKGFALLPRGCSIEMERVAREYIYETIKNNAFDVRRLRRELVSFEHNTGETLTLTNFVKYLDIDIRLIYKNSWNILLRDAGLIHDNPSALQRYIEEHLYTLCHTNSASYIQSIRSLINADFDTTLAGWSEQLIKTFYYGTFYEKLNKINKEFGTQYASMEEALKSMKNMPTLKEELCQLLDYLLVNNKTITEPLAVATDLTFELYRRYTRDEATILMKGDISRGSISGLMSHPTEKVQILFCTINKSDKEFSPSTMYADYAVDSQTFMWQPQNSVKAGSRKSREYTDQSSNGIRFILFVRERKRDAYGLTMPYYCLGDVKFVEYSEDERKQMVIKWQLNKPMPGLILEKAQVAV